MASLIGRNVARKLVRSVIFTPADRPSAMMKAVNSLDADVVVLDLEDAVSPDLKLTARSNVVNFLKSGPFNRCSVVVRVNCPKTTPWGIDDINALYNLGLDAIILPKVEEESMINLTTSITKERSHTGILELWCMIETVKGVQNVDLIANLESVQTLVFGSNDLTKDLKARHTATREPLLYSMSRCIVASRAAQKTIIDGVHMDISDDEGLTRSCIQGRDLGFDGKSLIHPSQIALTNSHYSPSEADVLHAHKIIQSFLSATASGKSVSVLDNKLVEKLHVEQAEQLIAEAEEISRLQKLRSELR